MVVLIQFLDDPSLCQSKISLMYQRQTLESMPPLSLLFFPISQIPRGEGKLLHTETLSSNDALLYLFVTHSVEISGFFCHQILREMNF